MCGFRVWGFRVQGLGGSQIQEAQAHKTRSTVGRMAQFPVVGFWL